jgi:predicted O-methyltransferase YrrM
MPLKSALTTALFFAHRTMLRTGITVLPNHYYVPIADANVLRKTRKSWALRAPLTGTEIVNIDRQAETLIKWVSPWAREFAGNSPYLDGVAQHWGPGFGYIEAQCLHGVLRTLKPRRIVEIGSGVSTHCMLEALALNEFSTQMTCIEPYPSAALMAAPQITQIAEKVQDAGIRYFSQLGKGDFLFIDSTHAVKTGGDVEHIYLRIIPSLAPEVVIHIHDIYFPFLFRPDVLNAMYQWNESGLLLALLTNNPRLSVLFCLSMLHHDRPDVLSSVFPEYRPRAVGPDGLDVLSRAFPEYGAGPRRPNGPFADRLGHFPSSIYLMTK